jgi:hypothetical protein
VTDSNLPAEQSAWTALTKLPAVEPDESALRYVARLMQLLPPQPDDVIDSIAAQILAAPTAAEENRLWDATGSRDVANRAFVFHSVHLQPSDYEDALIPWYLVCKVTDQETGEKRVLTTGSINIMTALVKAQMLGNLPWEAEIVGPRRTPKSGRIPLHLRWLGKIVEPQEEDC